MPSVSTTRHLSDVDSAQLGNTSANHSCIIPLAKSMAITASTSRVAGLTRECEMLVTSWPLKASTYGVAMALLSGWACAWRYQGRIVGS
eukprot:CAMPEP_0177256202 /NCGR_PEP_ID=MMETSP0367-20130122/56802_1 /TAXON_ID=447022 ORGANISM="Scrippsiella hangoei-like, Strain SHHI-4" /NCGR_SAMPLE_ID=MMETSP0367 /ASSEMBLY_ACC=CAM_ASM_000362 /LENGTH=88 /DNA_ID=CAMNT_0018710043 /DNA_START=9 /DNA_END=275 /DNA_ORIENTATION=-